MRLVITPYHGENSVDEDPVCSDKGTGVPPHTETSGPLSNAELSSDESTYNSHSADITESFDPDDTNVKFSPGLDFLAAATASNKSLQQELKVKATTEKMPEISTSNPAMTTED